MQDNTEKIQTQRPSYKGIKGTVIKTYSIECLDVSYVFVNSF